MQKKLKRNVKSLILSVSLMTLLGCSTTVPLSPKFPKAPSELLEPSSDLKALPEDKKTLTDLIENANENYGTYYDLKNKYDMWIEWYNQQKKIFEDIK